MDRETHLNRLKLLRTIKNMPLFLRLYLGIIISAIFFIIDAFKWTMLFLIALPLSLLGFGIYLLIIRPIKWCIGLFITIERVDIYE